MRKICVCVLLFSAVVLYAEVYSLWPFAKGSSSGTFSDPSQVLPKKQFWNENILINGAKVRMDIALVDMEYEDAVKVLLKQFPQAQIAKNPTSMLLNVTQKDGSSRRIFLVKVKGTRPLLQYSMLLPAGRSKATAAQWPKNIPLLPGAKDLNVMVFPKRNATYASCFIPNATRPQLVHEMSKRLLSQGWQAASEEIANPFKASGEVFLREKPLELMLLGISKTSQDGTMLSIYTRPVENRNSRK
ncbi:MAG: hypothetical protein IKB16_16005 [Lentisphaeria bacterium]|nr:hypothetical protein [Lentisphaeria bacterium]